MSVCLVCYLSLHFAKEEIVTVSVGSVLAPSGRKLELLFLSLGGRHPPNRRLGSRLPPQGLDSSQRVRLLSAVSLAFLQGHKMVALASGIMTTVNK